MWRVVVEVIARRVDEVAVAVPGRVLDVPASVGERLDVDDLHEGRHEQRCVREVVEELEDAHDRRVDVDLLTHAAHG